MLGKSDPTSREMQEVVMQNAELISRREASERLVKILDSTYVKSNLKQVANSATQLNSEEKNQLLRILEYFDDLLVVL